MAAKKEGYVQINIQVPQAIKAMLPDLRTASINSDTAVIIDLIEKAHKKLSEKKPKP